MQKKKLESTSEKAGVTNNGQLIAARFAPFTNKHGPHLSSGEGAVRRLARPREEVF